MFVTDRIIMGDLVGFNREISTDPMHLTQRVAEQALVLIPAATGSLVGLWDEGEYLTYVCGAGHLKPHVGFKLRMEGSLSGISARSGMVVYTDDASTDPRVDADSCRALNVSSSVCVPLMRGGKAFGVLNVSSPEPRAFVDSDRAVLANLASFVSVVVGAAADIDRVTRALFETREPTSGCFVSTAHKDLHPMESRFVETVLDPEVADRADVRTRIQQTLDKRAISMVFQPIVQLESGGILGFEALSRFCGDAPVSPDIWFQEAHSVGLGVELELLAIEIALVHQSGLPAHAVLAINAGPDVILNEDLHRMLRRSDASQVIVELTEHKEVTDYPGLVDALSALRNTGARLSIDDTGAGVSSLAHILKLSPEFIKLDRALTTGIDQDPVRRALASSLVSFAAETGPVIVAEGIETAGELGVLRSLGISYGQGYYLGSPQPLSRGMPHDPRRAFLDVGPIGDELTLGRESGSESRFQVVHGRDAHRMA